MPETTPAPASRESDAERVQRLIPVMGVENARRLVASQVTDEQRERLAKLVASAPVRLRSDAAG